MTDAVEGTAFDSAPVEAVEPAATTGPDTSGVNPAWKSWEDKLGPIQFEAVKPLLRENDQRVQQLMEKTHREYEPLKAFEQYKDVGVENVNIGIQLKNMLDDNPVAFVKMLQQNPQVAAALAAEAGNAPVETEPEDDGEFHDPRYDQLAQQQQALQQHFEQQEAQRVAHEADQAVGSELASLRQAHPNFDNDDMAFIVNQALAQASTTGKLPPLEEIAKGYEGLINRKLSTPRAGSFAPTVMPTSGGVPSSAPTRSLGTLSSKEVTNLVGGLIKSQKNT